MPVILQERWPLWTWCDCFHFANHTDKWCKKNCNPYKTANLEVNNNCVTKGNNIKVIEGKFFKRQANLRN